RDAVFGVPPFSRSDALAMIGRLRSQNVLQGVRGREPVDIGALADAVCAISRLAMEHPEITELDVNPVFAGSSGIVAVDWLMLGIPDA
ncbi:MAG: acetate--CoA ligase family protein, partial [Thiobacillus sp.]|nr:acetate--CoA ligase family protein [Thiobacillus sp.]